MQKRVGVIAGNPLIKWEHPDKNEGLVITPQIIAFEQALRHAAELKNADLDVSI
jgi:hypothetical protein